MAIEDLFTETLTLKRTTAETRDAIGGTSVDEEATLEVLAYLEPMTGQGDMREDRANRNTQIGDWLAVVPAGTDVDGWDRAEARGRDFEIVGPPAAFVDPSAGAEHHIELLLRAVE